jgi:hypothetical protein
MPKPKAVELPTTLKFETISGQRFVEIKAAAKLAGVHPVALEMAQKLLKDLNQGARFVLADRKMEEKASAIEELFRAGLKKVAKAMGQRLAVRSHKDGNSLVFWYDSRGPGLQSKRKVA